MNRPLAARIAASLPERVMQPEYLRVPARVVFGRNVRSIRKVRKLTQEGLASACWLHRAYIGSVERGERNISIDNMEEIAMALGVELADLLVDGFGQVMKEAATI